MKLFLKKSAFVIFLVILGFVLFFPGYFFFTKPKYKGRESLEGLREEVKVITDRWGVPHIYAANEADLFFACGYIHAKERMWQMDLTRRTGFGRLSELFGESLLERDKYVRVMGLKEAALRDYERIHSEVKDILGAYCQGVNAWLDSRKGCGLRNFSFCVIGRSYGDRLIPWLSSRSWPCCSARIFRAKSSVQT